MTGAFSSHSRRIRWKSPVFTTTFWQGSAGRRERSMLPGQFLFSSPQLRPAPCCLSRSGREVHGPLCQGLKNSVETFTIGQLSGQVPTRISPGCSCLIPVPEHAVPRTFKIRVCKFEEHPLPPGHQTKCSPPASLLGTHIPKAAIRSHVQQRSRLGQIYRPSRSWCTDRKANAPHDVDWQTLLHDARNRCKPSSMKRCGEIIISVPISP